MAAARFQMYVVARAAATEDTDLVSDADRRLGVTWRLLSTNNRDLGRATGVFSNVESCLAAIRDLQRRLPSAAATIARGDRASWTWRIAVGGVDIAVSSRGYQRRVHCEYACSVFLGLVPDAAVTDAPRVVHS